MSKFDDLAFAVVPPTQARPKDGPGVTVSVRANDKIKVSFNAAAYAKLGKPEALKVEAAITDDGNIIKLTPAAKNEGWAVQELSWPTRPERAPSASVTIAVHPFEIGVTHRAVSVDCEWGGASARLGSAQEPTTFLFVTLPDWDAMLAGLEAGAEADD